jgi:hypothetical protein
LLEEARPVSLNRTDGNITNSILDFTFEDNIKPLNVLRSTIQKPVLRTIKNSLGGGYNHYTKNIINPGR